MATSTPERTASPPTVRRARMARTGAFTVPVAEIFWMQGFLELDDLWLSALLVETDDHMVLVNTGLPDDITLYAQTMKAWDERTSLRRGDGEHITDVLASWGVSPDDIDVVVLSPLAPYACGGLHLFPRAEICASRAGWSYMFAPPPAHLRPPPSFGLTETGLQFLTGEAWPRLRLLEDDGDVIVPGLRSFRAGVHHIASLALLFDGPDGTMCYSDAFFRYANVEMNTPLGIGRSLDEAYTSYDRIRKEADILVPAFDPAAWERHPDGVLV